MENGTYQLIAVTTRDDDMFYVIIDKTKKENNVYFLNEVDTADLDKLANDDSNVSNGDSSTETTAPADEDADTSHTERQQLLKFKQFIYVVSRSRNSNPRRYWLCFL